MSVQPWPAELPQKVLASGFDMTLQDNARATPMEKGVPKIRRRSTKNIEPVSCTILADRSIWARLRRHYEEETSFGTVAFWLPDQIYDGAQMLTSAGVPLTTRGGSPILIRARWLVAYTPGSPPRIGNNRGPWFDVNFSLIKFPR